MALAFPIQGSLSVGIQHGVTAGQQFTGVAPGGVASVANGCNKFASHANGGLFNFEQSEPIIVDSFYAAFGAAVSTWTLSRVNLDAVGAPIAGEKFLVDSGSGEKDVLRANLNLVLLAKQALMLETTGATVAMLAAVIARSERSSNR